MIRYKIYQNKQKSGMTAGKWFARAVCDETYDLSRLAEHMASHNTPYSAGVIHGVLTDMIRCIKELLLDGKNVKIDDLAIFSVGIRCKAADKLEDFSLDKNVHTVRLRARATGSLSTANLKLTSQLKQQGIYEKPGSDNHSPEPTQPGGTETGEDPDKKPGKEPGKEPGKGEQTDTPDPIV